MRVLALEPYYGGSHRAFLDGWAAHSRHTWTVMGLPAHAWKWRMRHATWTLADRVAEAVAAGGRWDALVCSDMLSLAEFRGLAPEPVCSLPAVAYFHENQAAYPDARRDERDVHFAFSNLTTALAGRPWFNSAFHRDAFLTAMGEVFKQMPDHRSREPIERVARAARVMAPGIDPRPPRPSGRRGGPMRIAWAARWEADKDPDAFFAAVDTLDEAGVDFRLSVLGESFRRRPPIFDRAAEQFRDRIDHWGYLPRAAYRQALAEADVIVSTAAHEFFGLSIVEAAAAGAMPVLPERLAYPEVFGLGRIDGAADLFYAGDRAALAAKLTALAGRLSTTGGVWTGDPSLGRRLVEPLFWPRRAPALDDALEADAG